MFRFNLSLTVSAMLVFLVIWSGACSQEQSNLVTFLELEDSPEGIRYSNDRLGDGILYFAHERDTIWLLRLIKNRPVMTKIGTLGELIKIPPAHYFVRTSWTASSPKNGPWTIGLEEDIEIEELTSFDKFGTKEILTLKYDSQKGFKTIARINLEEYLYSVTQAMHVKDNISAVIGIGRGKPDQINYPLLRVDETTGKYDVISPNVQSLFDADYDSGRLFCIINDNLVQIDIKTLDVKKLCSIPLKAQDIVLCRLFYFPEPKTLFINQVYFTDKTYSPQSVQSELHKYLLEKNRLEKIPGRWFVRFRIDAIGLHCVGPDKKETIIDSTGRILSRWEPLKNQMILGYFKGENGKLIAVVTKLN